MTDDFLNAIFTIVDFAVDLSETIDSTKRSKPDIVEVPPDPTAPPPGAQRALAEVEERAREAAMVVRTS